MALHLPSKLSSNLQCGIRREKREDKPVLALMKDKPQDEIHQASLCLLVGKTECTAADAPHSLHMKLNRSTEDCKMATGFKAISDT